MWFIMMLCTLCFLGNCQELPHPHARSNIQSGTSAVRQLTDTTIEAEKRRQQIASTEDLLDDWIGVRVPIFWSPSIATLRARNGCNSQHYGHHSYADNECMGAGFIGGSCTSLLHESPPTPWYSASNLAVGFLCKLDMRWPCCLHGKTACFGVGQV